MDWLKDKKNQPIVALIAAVVIVAVVVVMYFTMFKSDSSSTDAGTATAPTTDPAMGTPAPTDPNATAQPAPTTDPNAAPAGGQPAAAGTAAPAAGGATAQASSAAPTETWRNDPFLPIGYKPPTKNKGPKPTPKIWDLPIPTPIFSGYTFSFKAKNAAKPVYEAPQPARRMAGLMLNGKVYAIIETNGASEIVQPGDTLKDGLATVEKIERDKIVLKTTDEKPRYLVVNMASNRQANAGSAGGNTGGGMPIPNPGLMPMPGPTGGLRP